MLCTYLPLQVLRDYAIVHAHKRGEDTMRKCNSNEPRTDSSLRRANKNGADVAVESAENVIQTVERTVEMGPRARKIDLGRAVACDHSRIYGRLL